MNPGQERLSWPQPIWDRINKAVHDETQRIRVASKFLPLHGPVEAGTLTVPSDTIIIAAPQPLMVDEAISEPLIEIWVELMLTAQQVAREREGDLMTAVTLATRATNLLSQAEDALLLLGQVAITGRGAGPGGQPPIQPNALFANNQVRRRSGPAGTGLLGWISLQIKSSTFQSLIRVLQSGMERTLLPPWRTHTPASRATDITVLMPWCFPHAPTRTPMPRW
ncbi:MAG: encapsulin [Candidatus Entotheonellia bacterium]